MKISGLAETINPKISSALGRDCQGSLAGLPARRAKQKSVGLHRWDLASHLLPFAQAAVGGHKWEPSLLCAQRDPRGGAGSVGSAVGKVGREDQACKESGFISSAVYSSLELGPYARSL